MPHTNGRTHKEAPMNESMTATPTQITYQPAAQRVKAMLYDQREFARELQDATQKDPAKTTIDLMGVALRTAMLHVGRKAMAADDALALRIAALEQRLADYDAQTQRIATLEASVKDLSDKVTALTSRVTAVTTRVQILESLMALPSAPTEPCKPVPMVFDVERDDDGLISQIVATPAP